MSLGNWLAIIPARGGSVSVPRKNLRLFDGQPLVARAVERASQAGFGTIIVSTDDPEIAAVAALAGADGVHDRSERTAGPDATVADVVAEVLEQAEREYDGVAVVQPTSPFLTGWTMAAALGEMVAEGYDSLMTVSPVLHHHWTKDGPVYRERVNRQALTAALWAETGGLSAVRTFPAPGGLLRGAPMIGDTHKLYEVDGPAALDIDDPEHLEAARSIAARRWVHFHVAAGHAIGSGHVRRCLTLADELPGHAVTFSVDAEEDWPTDLITAAGYPIREGYTLAEGLSMPVPEYDVLVIDALERGEERARHAAALGIPVVALEAEGPTALHASVLVNELLDGPEGALSGPQWSVLSPALRYLARVGTSPHKARAENVLVTFGGTDPACLTGTVHEALRQRANVRILTPPAGTTGRPGAMAEHLAWAHLVVTGQGRTVTEAAACGVPVVSIAVNGREASHVRIPGVRYLGLHDGVHWPAFTEQVVGLLGNQHEREWMADTARRAVGPTDGAERLAGIIARAAMMRSAR